MNPTLLRPIKITTSGGWRAPEGIADGDAALHCSHRGDYGGYGQVAGGLRRTRYLWEAAKAGARFCRKRCLGCCFAVPAAAIRHTMGVIIS